MIRYLSWACAIASLQLAVAAAAEICVYVDAEGRITYSNITEAPPKGAKKLRCLKPIAPAPSPPPPAQPQRASKPSDSDSDLPKVDAQTQRRRDDERRRILEQELVEEQQRLEEARKELAEQEAVRMGDERNYQRYLDRVQPYRERVENHQRNVEALQQELRNLR
jgi:hypothetical protein